jgi:predicted nucleic acid-binding protein
LGTVKSIVKTKLEQTLNRMKGKRVYFDTAPIIFAIENVNGYANYTLPFLKASEARSLFGFAGAITFCETLVKPLQLNNVALVARVKNLFEREDVFTCVDHSRNAYVLAAELRAAHRLKMVDALHLATAIDLRCDFFITNDFKFRENPRIEVVCIDDLRDARGASG